MSDEPGHGVGEDRPDRLTYARRPRWVKVFGVVAIVVLVLFVILLLAGGHSPRRHGAVGRDVGPSAVVVALGTASQHSV